MAIGSQLPTQGNGSGSEHDRRRWYNRWPAIVAFIVLVPFALLIAFQLIHRALETPAQRAQEDRALAVLAQQQAAQQQQEAAQQQLQQKQAEQLEAEKQAIEVKHAWLLASLFMAHERVKGALKDPDSVKFGHFWIVDQQNYSRETPGEACGFVNARNSFGGYTGLKRFIVSSGGAIEDDRTSHFAALWKQVCAAGRLIQAE